MANSPYFSLEVVREGLRLMVAEVFAGISGFKTMLDIVKSFKDTNDAAIRQAIALDLGEKILDARQNQEALIEERRGLKEKLASFERWYIEKERYELKAIYTGSYAYTLKKDKQDGEPPHWLCANCYQRGTKSFLQYKSAGIGRSDFNKHIYGCPECDAEVKVYAAVRPGSEAENQA